MYPFSDACRDQELRTLAQLDEKEIGFVRYTRAYAHDHRKFIAFITTSASLLALVCQAPFASSPMQSFFLYCCPHSFGPRPAVYFGGSGRWRRPCAGGTAFCFALELFSASLGSSGAVEESSPEETSRLPGTTASVGPASEDGEARPQATQICSRQRPCTRPPTPHKAVRVR